MSISDYIGYVYKATLVKLSCELLITPLDSCKAARGTRQDAETLHYQRDVCT